MYLLRIEVIAINEKKVAKSIEFIASAKLSQHFEHPASSLPTPKSGGPCQHKPVENGMSEITSCSVVFRVQNASFQVASVLQETLRQFSLQTESRNNGRNPQ